MAIYIDSLALLNFIINYLLLLAAAKIGGGPFRRWRLAAAALFGAGYAVLVWIPPFAPAMRSLPAKILSGAAMAAIAFAGVKPGRFIRLCAFFMGATFLLGGVVLALGMLTGAPAAPGGIPYMPVDFKVLFLVAGLSYAMLALVFRHMGRHGPAETAGVTIGWGDRKITAKALIDTGHTLTDPLSGSEVLILEPDCAKPLLPAAAAMLIDRKPLRDPVKLLEMLGTLGYGSRFRIVPYRVMGSEGAFLLVFRPDRVTVDGKARKNCLVGLAPTPLEAGAGIEGLVSVR